MFKLLLQGFKDMINSFTPRTRRVIKRRQIKFTSPSSVKAALQQDEDKIREDMRKAFKGINNGR